MDSLGSLDKCSPEGYGGQARQGLQLHSATALFKYRHPATTTYQMTQSLRSFHLLLQLQLFGPFMPVIRYGAATGVPVTFIFGETAII
jgi:hypothetical protein